MYRFRPSSFTFKNLGCGMLRLLAMVQPMFHHHQREVSHLVIKRGGERIVCVRARTFCIRLGQTSILLSPVIGWVGRPSHDLDLIL